MIYLDNVEMESDGRNHVFYYRDPRFPGVYVLYAIITDRVKGRWVRDWIYKHADGLFFSAENVGYLANHCKLYANLNGLKVYQYVGRTRKRHE